MMTVLVKLTRDGATHYAEIRQMAHDEPLVVGKKMRWGSGKMWTIAALNRPLLTPSQVNNLPQFRHPGYEHAFQHGRCVLTGCKATA